MLESNLVSCVSRACLWKLTSLTGNLPEIKSQESKNLNPPHQSNTQLGIKKTRGIIMS